MADDGIRKVVPTKRPRPVSKTGEKHVMTPARLASLAKAREARAAKAKRRKEMAARKLDEPTSEDIPLEEATFQKQGALPETPIEQKTIEAQPPTPAIREAELGGGVLKSETPTTQGGKHMISGEKESFDVERDFKVPHSSELINQRVEDVVGRDIKIDVLQGRLKGLDEISERVTAIEEKLKSHANATTKRGSFQQLLASGPVRFGHGGGFD